ATTAVAFAPFIETHEPSELLKPAYPRNQCARAKWRNWSRRVKPLTHHWRPYKKNDGGSSDSNRDGAGKAGMRRTKALQTAFRGGIMAVHYHEEDLPADVGFADGPIAIDTEAMGLVPGRDRLCLVQLSDGRGDEH